MSGCLCLGGVVVFEWVFGVCEWVFVCGWCWCVGRVGVLVGVCVWALLVCGWCWCVCGCWYVGSTGV